MYQKLRVDGFIDDHETIRSLLKALDADGVEPRTNSSPC